MSISELAHIFRLSQPNNAQVCLNVVSDKALFGSFVHVVRLTPFLVSIRPLIFDRSSQLCVHALSVLTQVGTFNTKRLPQILNKVVLWPLVSPKSFKPLSETTLLSFHKKLLVKEGCPSLPCT